MRKRFLAVFLALVLGLGMMPVGFADGPLPDHSGVAYPVTGGNIYFDKETGTVVGADEGVTAANIPAAIGGVAVTSIGDLAFHWSEGLESVTIPDGVAEIGNGAFGRLEKLTGVTIPASVEKIGANAFYKCTGLTSVTIAEGVKEIGWHAFSNCTGLISVTIPNSITEIGDNAFAFCTSLTSVTIPDSVTKIGDGAFVGCSSLPSVTIPDSVIEIDGYAFSACTSLTSITIPNSVIFIGGAAFRNCTSLASVTIPDSVTEIGLLAFDGCTSLTSVTVPNGLTKIEYRAFSNCTGLTSVTIPVSVKVIGAYAFDEDDAESEEMGPSESLKDIYYGGTKEQWDAISIDAENETLKTAAIHFNTPAFTDVPDWCAAPVAWAVGREITNGTGDNKFSPHDLCKHAEILTFLWRAADKPASSAALPVDITGKNVDWAADALRWAAEKGMVDGGLDPTARCTRADAVTYIWKALGGVEVDGEQSFSDVPDNADYAQAVAWAVANGVTNGYKDGTFGPGKTCSRGEIVTFLYRAYQ